MLDMPSSLVLVTMPFMQLQSRHSIEMREHLPRIKALISRLILAERQLVWRPASERLGKLGSGTMEVAARHFRILISLVQFYSQFLFTMALASVGDLIICFLQRTLIPRAIP